VRPTCQLRVATGEFRTPGIHYQSSIGQEIAMVTEYHPDWCSRAACTAYLDEGDEFHRSEPVVIKTDDPMVEIYAFKTAYQDGTDEYIEMVKLHVPAMEPWHLARPVLGVELVLPIASATAVLRAVAVLS
jgi:hypothetical protein